MPEVRELRRRLPTEEIYYQCAWCPCRFSSEHDLKLHLKAIGEEESIHKTNWERNLRGRNGYSRSD
ncbi:hypothetical protein MUP01_12505 [Candidatus Bathyarchaeota archaeon]|nr:hypothetical protein [Candidatus Bathyarchaeota archaeon]